MSAAVLRLWPCGHVGQHENRRRKWRSVRTREYPRDFRFGLQARRQSTPGPAARNKNHLPIPSDVTELRPLVESPRQPPPIATFSDTSLADALLSLLLVPSARRRSPSAPAAPDAFEHRCE